MINNEERLYLRKREQKILGFVKNEFRELERELCEQNASILKEMGYKLESKACQLYGGYDRHLLRKKKLQGDGTEIVAMIFILLSEHTEYYHREIVELYDKRVSSINNAKRDHKAKDKKIPHHKKYLEIFNELEKFFIDEVLPNKTHENGLESKV